MKLPDEFLERMKALLGDEYEDFLRTYDEPRRSGLRVNTLKLSAEEFEKIVPFPVKRLPWIPGGYSFERPEEKDGAAAEPSRHPFYYAGLYYLQEPSAMTPANILPVVPGDRVLDLCAAPGGKATALAAKLKGKGLLVANDISASRAKALLKNLETFGVSNAFVTNTDPSKLAERFPAFFDKILVDAPCSGEGMFRKEAANARAWSPEKVETCAKIQKGILRQAAAMLRPGGLLLYSTCTFAPEEDEQAVAYLLREFPEMELCEIAPWYEGFSHGRPELGRESWRQDAAGAGTAGGSAWEMKSGGGLESGARRRTVCGNEPEDAADAGMAEGEAASVLAQLDRCVRIFPHKMQGEGHFLALLKKADPGEDAALPAEDSLMGYEAYKSSDPPNRNPSREEWKILREFLQDVSPAYRREQIEARGGQIYLSVEGMPRIQGIPFLRNGLYLGEIRRGRFEPSQSFAMTLAADRYASVIDFAADDERTIRYLRGETVGTDDKNPARDKGWQLVCADGYPLGWGKLVNGTLKNKYHSGWRMKA